MTEERPLCGTYNEKSVKDWICSFCDLTALPVRCKKNDHCAYQEPKIYEKRV